MQQQFIFYFSAMKGGKTTRIFQRIHDFEENGQRVCLIKPKIDTKGGNCIINRLGERKEVTMFLSKTESLLTKKKEKLLTNYQQIIVDEAQFLTPKQVEQLWIINKSKNIPVTCFGLKSNFQGKLFPATTRLLALADKIGELDSNSICKCGRLAKFNAKKVNGKYTLFGDEIEIDGVNKETEYVPLCGKCFYEKVVKGENYEN